MNAWVVDGHTSLKTEVYCRQHTQKTDKENYKPFESSSFATITHSHDKVAIPIGKGCTKRERERLPQYRRVELCRSCVVHLIHFNQLFAQHVRVLHRLVESLSEEGSPFDQAT